MHYHNDDADSLTVNLNFSQSSDVLPMHFNVFEHDYQSFTTGFDLANVDSINGEATTYTQSMGGAVSISKYPG
ncbi:MAG: hypothetical protein U5L96_00040 [Owenweeksia sp.]|nr:hypothetical protein [Owenweeksia sp.]